MRISEFLAEPLSPAESVTELTKLCEQMARQESEGVVEDLRSEITRRAITSEDYRRLGVLISQLYQLAEGVDLRLAKSLFVEVQGWHERGRSAIPQRVSDQE